MNVSLSYNIVLCLNFLMKDISQHNLVAVVDLDLKIDFPSVRINFGSIENLDSLPQIPSAYVVNLDQIGEKELTHILKKFGHSISTKYVFIGQSWMSPFNPHFSSEYFRNVIFINSENCEIFQVLDPNVEPKKNKNCLENCSEVRFEEMRFDVAKSAFKICFFSTPPYVMGDEEQKKGIETEIFRTISRLLKTEGEFTTFFALDGELSQFLEFILNNGSCDVFSGIYPIAGNFDLTHWLYIDSMIWVVKSAEEIPRWRYAFDVFSPETWMFWILSAVCITIAQYTITVVTNQNGGLKDGLIMFLKYFLEQTESFESKVAAKIILFGSLLFATFFMNVLYKSNFMFLLTGIKYDVDVNSLEEAMRNGYTFRCEQSALQYLQEPEEIEYFENHYEEINLSLENLRKKSAQLMLEKMFSYSFSDFLDENNRATMRKLERPLIQLPFGALLRRGSDLTRVLNEKLELMADMGILTWIYSRYFNEVEEGNSVRVRKLSLDSIQLPIFLWVIGITISVLVSIYEIKISKIFENQKKLKRPIFNLK